MSRKFDEATGLSKHSQYRMFLNYLANVSDVANFKSGIDKIVAFRDAASTYNARTKAAVNEQLVMLKNKKLAKKNQENAPAIAEMVEYIEAQLK
jgi:hypothetical protein